LVGHISILSRTFNNIESTFRRPVSNVDLYDANRKLWKAISYYNDFHNHPPLGRTIDGVASVAYDLQNTHMTVWCGYANAGKLLPYIDFESPKEYMNGVKYGSPSGLMQILR
jgi:hypothetical protein